jgi:hypothetical protein
MTIEETNKVQFLEISFWLSDSVEYLHNEHLLKQTENR